MAAKSRTQVCNRHSAGGEIIGTACEDCGHTNVVHPNLGNPSLKACAICEIIALVSDARKGKK